MSTGNASIGLSRNAGQRSSRAIGGSAIPIRTSCPLRRGPGNVAANGASVSCSLLRASDPIAKFVSHEITQPLSAVAQNLQHTLVDKISQQDRIAGFHAVMNRIGRVPGVVADSKSIAAVRRKSHLRLLRHGTVGQLLVKDRADVDVGIVFWQIELDRDSFPVSVGMRRNEIAGNVARQDWNWIHPDFGKFISEAL